MLETSSWFSEAPNLPLPPQAHPTRKLCHDSSAHLQTQKHCTTSRNMDTLGKETKPNSQDLEGQDLAPEISNILKNAFSLL